MPFPLSLFFFFHFFSPWYSKPVLEAKKAEGGEVISYREREIRSLHGVHKSLALQWWYRVNELSVKPASVLKTHNGNTQQEEKKKALFFF